MFLFLCSCIYTQAKPSNTITKQRTSLYTAEYVCSAIWIGYTLCYAQPTDFDSIFWGLVQYLLHIIMVTSSKSTLLKYYWEMRSRYTSVSVCSQVYTLTCYHNWKNIHKLFTTLHILVQQKNLFTSQHVLGINKC